MVFELDLQRAVVEEFGGPRAPDLVHLVAAHPVESDVGMAVGEVEARFEGTEGDLAMEMADILFVIICMANREGIDLQEAFDRMMAKVEHRDTTRWTRKGR